MVLETLLILAFLFLDLVSSAHYDHTSGTTSFNDKEVKSLDFITPPSSRGLNVIVNECLDATDYFNRFNAGGVNNLRNHYECKCSGDLGSSFTLDCEMSNYCFWGEQEDGSTPTQQCISRKVVYDFLVNPSTGRIENFARGSQSTTYHSGFAFTGTFLTVSNNPCVNELQSIDPTLQVGEDAIAICDNRTECRDFLTKNTNRTQDEIEYICPFVSFDNVECQNPRIGRCSPDDDTIRYRTMPDCSNVDPCLTASCQPHDSSDTSPKSFLFRYPECNHTNNDGTNDVLPPPTAAPTVASICSKAISYLGTGEMLKQYYNCVCSGNLVDSVTLDCSLENYCFTERTNATFSVDYCVNQNATFTYQLVNQEEIGGVTRAKYCTEYLQNELGTSSSNQGPILCRQDASVCKLCIQRFHGETTPKKLVETGLGVWNMCKMPCNTQNKTRKSYVPLSHGTVKSVLNLAFKYAGN